MKSKSAKVNLDELWQDHDTGTVSNPCTEKYSTGYYKYIDDVGGAIDVCVLTPLTNTATTATVPVMTVEISKPYHGKLTINQNNVSSFVVKWNWITDVLVLAHNTNKSVTVSVENMTISNCSPTETIIYATAILENTSPVQALSLGSFQIQLLSNSNQIIHINTSSIAVKQGSNPMDISIQMIHTNTTAPSIQQLITETMQSIQAQETIPIHITGLPNTKLINVVPTSDIAFLQAVISAIELNISISSTVQLPQWNKLIQLKGECLPVDLITRSIPSNMSLNFGEPTFNLVQVAPLTNTANAVGKPYINVGYDLSLSSGLPVGISLEPIQIDLYSGADNMLGLETNALNFDKGTARLDKIGMEFTVPQLNGLTSFTKTILDSDTLGDLNIRGVARGRILKMVNFDLNLDYQFPTIPGLAPIIRQFNAQVDQQSTKFDTSQGPNLVELSKLRFSDCSSDSTRIDVILGVNNTSPFSAKSLASYNIAIKFQGKEILTVAAKDISVLRGTNEVSFTATMHHNTENDEAFEQLIDIAKLVHKDPITVFISGERTGASSNNIMRAILNGAEVPVSVIPEFPDLPTLKRLFNVVEMDCMPFSLFGSFIG